MGPSPPTHSVPLSKLNVTVFMVFVHVQGDMISASRHLEICLRALKRPLPVSKLDVGCGLLWQLMRHVLHRLWIGTWLASAAGGIKLRNRSSDSKDHARISAKDAAMAYHQLHQLSLTGTIVIELIFESEVKTRLTIMIVKLKPVVSVGENRWEENEDKLFFITIHASI